jgi:hypothetical protein
MPGPNTLTQAYQPHSLCSYTLHTHSQSTPFLSAHVLYTLVLGQTTLSH